MAIVKKIFEWLFKQKQEQTGVSRDYPVANPETKPDDQSVVKEEQKPVELKTKPTKKRGRKKTVKTEK